MRIVLAVLGAAFVGACTRGDREDFSGEASRVAGQQGQQRCAADGKRAQLRNTTQNLDGSRSYEYVCVQ